MGPLLNEIVEIEPGYPPLVMFKAVLLQSLYGLSDPGLEEALYDRLSFRRFVGLGLEDAVPDHSTICRFRLKLIDGGLLEKLFGELGASLVQPVRRRAVTPTSGR